MLQENQEKPGHAELIALFDNLVMQECAPVSNYGAIIVPEAHQKILNQGLVVDKGPQVSDVIKLGDIVFFTQHSESRLNFRNQKFIMVSESNCIGIIRGAKVNEEEPSAIIKP